MCDWPKAVQRFLQDNGLAKGWPEGKPAPPHIPKIANDTDMSNFEMDGATGAPLDPSWANPASASENALFSGFSL